MKPAANFNNDTDIFLQMHRLFKRLQQRNRFVDIEPTSALTLAEAHLLKESITQPNLTQAGYQKLFSLPQSHIARVINRLARRGFLVKKVDPNDSRAIRVLLTPAGQAAVALSDRVTNECYESFARLLKKTEKKELTRFFKEIADGYGHPAAKLRQGELEYSLQQRRITRCFKLLGKRVFDSDFNSTQWQLLSVLAESATPMSAHSITQKIGLTAGAITAVIKDLLKKNLILVVTNRLDKRAINISITPLGRKAIFEVEQTAADELKHALKNHTHRQCREWLAILTRYVVDSDESIAVAMIGATIKQFVDQSDKASARALLISLLVQQNLQQFCPALLAGEDNIVIGFQRASSMIALFDMQNDGKSVKIT